MAPRGIGKPRDGNHAILACGGMKKQGAWMSDASVTTDSIEEWLIGLVAAYLDAPSAEIDPVLSLKQQGVDSLCRFEIREEIESQFGVKLGAKLVTGTSEIHDLAGLIFQRLAG